MKRESIKVILLAILLTVFSLQINAQIYRRTELYFGLDKNDGKIVNDAEWNQFLDEFVTPKFPNGFTVVDANGQFRLQNGTIVKEKSKVLLLLYSPAAKVITNKKINQIRSEYKRRFNQESVMRIDFRQIVKVSF